MMNDSTSYYDVFLSHNPKDKTLMRELAEQVEFKRKMRTYRQG